MDLRPPRPPAPDGGLRLKNETTKRAGCYLPAKGPGVALFFHRENPLPIPRPVTVRAGREPCARKANGSRLCLDDPAYSTANGTQLIVYTCSDTRNQRWTLPGK